MTILLIQALDLGIAVVEEEDLVVGLALLAHDGGTDLTEAYAVAPATSVEYKSLLLTPVS